jgi:hypothetical protein
MFKNYITRQAAINTEDVVPTGFPATFSNRGNYYMPVFLPTTALSNVGKNARSCLPRKLSARHVLCH